MKTLEINNTSFKNLTYFYLAAFSLYFSGFIGTTIYSYTAIIIQVISVFLGVFLVYRINDVIDNDSNFSFSLRVFLSHPKHIIAFVALLIAIPIAIVYLSPFSFIVLGISAIVGFLYSFRVRIFQVDFRLKNIFLIKNILIGFVWGALLLISSGCFNQYLFNLFLFISIQVFIGSIIRDLADKASDLNDGVNSLPILIGEKPTIHFLHFINFGSLFTIYVSFDKTLFALLILVVLWRCINLIFLHNNYQSVFWGQKVNLLTCTFIFILLFIKSFIQ